MNDNKTTKTKTIIAAATIMAVVYIRCYDLRNTNVTVRGSPDLRTTASSAGSASNPVMVNPSQTTNKEFWINTVHLDGQCNEQN